MKKWQQKPNQKADKQLKQLYYIFTYYCSFADRQNLQMLKLQNFRRMLIDAQLLQTSSNANTSNTSNNNNVNNSNNYSSNEQIKQLDLLYAYTKKNNSGISFQNFLTILPQIAKILYKQNHQTGLKKMINQHFHALYQFIYDNTEIGQCIKYFAKTSFSENCFVLLRALSPTLYRIYDYYFDVNCLEIIKESSEIFKKITLFTKNFQITPQIITKTQSFLIFNYLLNEERLAQSVYKQWFEQQSNKNLHKPAPSSSTAYNIRSSLIKLKNPNLNQNLPNIHKSHPIFTFFNFIQYILILSLIANRKIVGLQMTSNFRRLINFLQIMEVSNGFVRLCRREKINLHLVNVNQKLIRQLESQEQENKDDIYGLFQRTVLELSSPNNNKDKDGNALSPNRYVNSSNSDNINEKLLQNYSTLHKKFIELCLYGQTIGSSSLTHKKIIDIIKGMQLGLRQSQIQVYIASINSNSNNSNTNKDKQTGGTTNNIRREWQKIPKPKSKSLQFQQFILLLQKIAQKQNLQIQKIIDKIMRRSISQSRQKYNQVNQDQNQQKSSYKFRLGTDYNKDGVGSGNKKAGSNSRDSLYNVKLNRSQYRNCIAMVEMLEEFLYAAFMLEIQPASSTPSTNKSFINLNNNNSNIRLNRSRSTKNNNNKSSRTLALPNPNNLNTNMTFISLNSYLKILHEFQLTPLYLSKQSIIEIFRKSIKKSYDFMSFSQFKDSFIIGVAYFDVGYESVFGGRDKDNDKSNTNNNRHNKNNTKKECHCKRIKPQTKLIIILERINQSRGATKISKHYPTSFNINRQDNLSKFRQIFNQFYPQNVDKNIQNSQCYCRAQDKNEDVDDMEMEMQMKEKEKKQEENFRQFQFDQKELDNRLHSYTFGGSSTNPQNNNNTNNTNNNNNINFLYNNNNNNNNNKNPKTNQNQKSDKTSNQSPKDKPNHSSSHKYGNSNHSSNSNRDSYRNSYRNSHNNSLYNNSIKNHSIHNNSVSYTNVHVYSQRSRVVVARGKGLK